MAFTSKNSYRRLKKHDEDEDDKIRERVIGRVKSWPKMRKVRTKKRLRIKKLLRRKADLLVASWGKTLKRLKESKSHFGYLFAGNYLFTQVAPDTLKCVEKTIKGRDHLHGLSSKNQP